MNLIIKAARFAEEKHRGQFRKYSDNVPYIVHPCRVASKVMLLADSTEDMVCAAFLHDVEEDCGVTFEQLNDEFGYNIAALVDDLTNISKKDTLLNRAARKKADAMRLSACCREAKIIKLCDRIDNLRDIPNSEPFKPKYIRESVDLHEQALYGVHAELDKEIIGIFNDFWNWHANKIQGEME